MRRLLLLLLTLTACHTITSYPEQPPMTHGAFAQETALRVHWQPDVDAVARFCAPRADMIVYACARPDLAGGCDVYAIKPDNFNDGPKLKLLGHEVFHCLGASHLESKGRP